jgi:phosphatidylserine/phosphatidylglycerophosphate/cardiolipin synthase-like enzyme
VYQFPQLKKTVLFLCIFICGNIYAQIPISEARASVEGTQVTITGIITSGPEWGQVRFMQDETAGIALFSPNISSLVAGDSVIVTGILTTFRQQIELSPVNSYEIISRGHLLPDPIPIQLQDGVPFEYESMRVMLPCGGLVTCEHEYSENVYPLFDHQGREIQVSVYRDHELIGSEIPKGAVITTGIWRRTEDQFSILAESILESTSSTCIFIQPGVVGTRFEELHLSWSYPALHEEFFVEYGIDSFDQSQVVYFINSNLHFKPQNILPGHIYKARIRKIIGIDTFYSPVNLFSSITPAYPVEVFFNRQVNADYSDGSSPTGVGPAVIETDLIDRINSVTSTLDVAMYNSSREPIVQAIRNAVQRGVIVRYIADDETSNSALQGSLPFPVLFRAGPGIMHNKFLIGDADDPDHAWVWTGSTNHSASQISTDPNHAVILRGQAIARNYRREFEEMWGKLPDHSDGRTGELKKDNTIHTFRTDTYFVDSHFSPSDETNCYIIDALYSADHHIEIGLLIITRDDIVVALADLFQQGIDIRIIIDDVAGSGEAVDELRQAGIPVAHHDLSSIFHHKYAIIDEGFTDSDPIVISGSHNWTNSAETINDENTLLIHDQSVANIFRQEFEARWGELVETSIRDEFHTSDHDIYPNPVSSAISFVNELDDASTVLIHDLTGNLVSEIPLSPQEDFIWEIYHDIPDGIYFLHQISITSHLISRFVVQRQN